MGTDPAYSKDRLRGVLRGNQDAEAEAAGAEAHDAALGR
jgi:hypothetical protein